MTRWTESDLATLKSKSRVIVHKQDVHASGPRTNTGTITSTEWKRQNGLEGQKRVPAPVRKALRSIRKRPNVITGYVRERDVLKAVLGYLRLHPRVSWIVRINTGAIKYENRFIRFGMPGFSDIIGQLKDGRLLAIEVKASNGKATPEQQAFITKVNAAGGVGCVARSVEDVAQVLREDTQVI